MFEAKFHCEGAEPLKKSRKDPFTVLESLIVEKISSASRYKSTFL